MYEQLYNTHKPYKPARDWKYIGSITFLLAAIAAVYWILFCQVRENAGKRAEEEEFRASVQEELMLLRRDLDHNTRVMEVLGALIESNTAELDRIDTVRRVLEQEMLTYVEEGVAPPQIFVELYAKTLKVRQPGE